MPGWGDAIGFIFNLFGSKEERRRNAIEQLEKEQQEILKKPANYTNTKRMQSISAELARLYKEARNR